MSKIIKSLSSKLEKMEMEGRNLNRHVREGGNRNQNQYRRLFNQPQILQRERRNNDAQNIKPPLQNNYVDETKEHENIYFDNEIHLVGEYQSTSFLTQYDYEGSLACNQLDEDIEESDSLSYNILQNEEYKRYNLRNKPTGTKQNTQQQNKKTTTPIKQVLDTIVRNEVENKKENQSAKVGEKKKRS